VRARFAAWAVLALALLSGCGLQTGVAAAPEDPGAVRVVTTTNFITDVAREVGGERVSVEALMGPGVDPHQYKPSAGDVARLSSADVVLYGGLELEGKMDEVFEEFAESRPTVAVTRDLPRDRLIPIPEAPGEYDPHVWFDVPLWSGTVATVAAALAEADPAGAPYYEERAAAYRRELAELDAYVERRLAAVPEGSRVLVTSHDAFAYFGRRHRFRVLPIQGVSTATEATTADIERVAAEIARARLKAVFVESSLPRQTLDAVLASAARRGQRAEVGGELFSDAAGDAGTVEGTYVGMVRHNADLIAEGLR